MPGASPTIQTPSEVNADFSQRVLLATDELEWHASPQAGVQRRFLDRIGTEVARATSLVRYAPASHFPAHKHAAGEEFLVLEGTFSDESGDYPAGTYVRNPPGSEHAPFTDKGCIIFVKLRQMKPDGEPHIVVDTTSMSPMAGAHDGITTTLLYAADDGCEQVCIDHIPRGTRFGLSEPNGGCELLLLEGQAIFDDEEYAAGAWIRLPSGDQMTIQSLSDCRYWIKRGHL